MSRRGENIRKRKDGRWEARYIRMYKEDGKAKYGYLYARTYAEVKRKKADAMQKSLIQQTSVKTEARLLCDVMDAWLESKAGFIKQSTFCNYSTIIQRYLRPALGGYAVSAITNAVVEQYIQEKRKNGRLDGKGALSTKTVSDQIIVLRLVLRYAVSQNMLSPDVLSFHAPKPVKRAPKLLNEIDWQRLNRYVRKTEEASQLGILIAMHTGLRIGEVCALRYSDIDFASGVLSVNHTMQRIKSADRNETAKTKIIIDAPKTECSHRKIPLPTFLIPMLAEHQQQAVSREAYITTGNASYTEPRVYYRQYQAIQKQCGISGYSFHALRHTFATRCIENGCDPKTLSELLGHASVKITLERYMHPSMSAKRAVMDRLADCDSWSDNAVKAV